MQAQDASSIYFGCCVYCLFCSYCSCLVFIILVLIATNSAFSSSDCASSLDLSKNDNYGLTNQIILSSELQYGWHYKAYFNGTRYMAQSRCGYSNYIDLYYSDSPVFKTGPESFFSSNSFYVEDCSGETKYEVKYHKSSVTNSSKIYSLVELASNKLVMSARVTETSDDDSSYVAVFYDAGGTEVGLGKLKSKVWNIYVDDSIEPNAIYKNSDVFMAFVSKILFSMINSSSLMDVCNFFYTGALDYVLICSGAALLVGMGIIYFPWNQF